MLMAAPSPVMASQTARQLSDLTEAGRLDFSYLSDGPLRLITHTLDNSPLDPDATPLEVEVWREAALYIFAEYGVNFRVINAVKTMAQHISHCSEEELSLK